MAFLFPFLAGLERMAMAGNNGVWMAVAQGVAKAGNSCICSCSICSCFVVVAFVAVL